MANDQIQRIEDKIDKAPLATLGANSLGLTLGPVVLLTPAGSVLLAGDAATPLGTDVSTAVTAANAQAASALAALSSSTRSSFQIITQPAAGTPSSSARMAAMAVGTGQGTKGRR